MIWVVGPAMHVRGYMCTLVLVPIFVLVLMHGRFERFARGLNSKRGSSAEERERKTNLGPMRAGGCDKMKRWLWELARWLGECKA